MKLIILDRDGVINHDSDDYIKTAEQWLPIDGSLEAISRLNQHAYTVAVVSNQSGLARGYFSGEALVEMHQKMQKLLANVGAKVAAIFYCPHAPNDGCDCRKPKPGMLLEVAQRFSVSLNGVYFIGDSFSDIVAAKKVNATPLLVRTGKGKLTEKMLQEKKDNTVLVYDNLADAVETILKKNNKND